MTPKSHSTPAGRLTLWCDDIQLSARTGFPHYAHPGEMKDDIRALIEQADAHERELIKEMMRRTKADARIAELEEQFEAMREALRKVRGLCAEGHGDDLIAEVSANALAGVSNPASDSDD